MAADEIRKALHAAFVEAIQRVGLETFKATSMFKSNERRADKLAA